MPLTHRFVLFDLVLEAHDRHINFVKRSILRIKPKRPWMRRREMLVVEEVIKKTNPQHCLEWGAGYSTLYFPKLLSSSSRWISVENNPNWIDVVKKLNLNSRVEIHFVKTDESREDNENDQRKFSDYIDYPQRFGKFDFIFVDGRSRPECIRKASDLLNPLGIVILHDANRSRYQEVFSLFPHSLLLKDFRIDEGGLWLASRERNLDSILDVGGLQRLWKNVNRFGKIIRL